ncbi:MAG TPA: nucleotidyltransferase domain-containing protein [Verrucomicrobiae bacterium]|nr:nucleotidyltransferase domain-containing protein [Verrucomicrobiae bacterium]
MREIERRSGLNVATVRQELQRLIELGLVSARKDGNRVCYTANQQHPLYPDIHNLVLKTSGLVEVLRSALKKADIDLAFVFGSLARGEERPESDVDLMTIGNVSLRKLTELLSGAADKVGREINPHAITRDEFKKRCRARDHFIATVLDAPKLFVIGTEHELEAMGG